MPVYGSTQYLDWLLCLYASVFVHISSIEADLEQIKIFMKKSVVWYF